MVNVTHSFEAKGDVKNYWIRAGPPLGLNAPLLSVSNGINAAILRYAGAPAVDPAPLKTTSTMPLVEANLHPLEDPSHLENPMLEVPMS